MNKYGSSRDLRDFAGDTGADYLTLLGYYETSWMGEVYIWGAIDPTLRDNLLERGDYSWMGEPYCVWSNI